MSERVPKEWKEFLLQQLGEIVGGGTPASETPEYWGGNVQWATPTEITNLESRYISRTKRTLTEEGLSNSSAKLHPVGTILLTSRASIGYPAITQVPMATNQGFQSLRPNEKLNVEYGYQLLLQSRRHLESLSAGSTFLEISSNEVKKFKLPIPPLPEQKKIASILTSVDEVIEKTQKQIDKLQDLKKATMNELLTKGIGHTEFKDSELGRIPKSWEVVELREYLEFISYGFTNPMPESKFGNLMVTAKDINYGTIDYDNARRTTYEAFDELLTDKSRPKIDDLLLTKDGTLGRLAVVQKDDICINQSVAVLRLKDKISSMFLFYMLSSPYYQKTMLDNAGGSTIKHIYITVIDKMKVVRPPSNEQDEITIFLSAIDTQLKTVIQKLQQTQSLKKSLMQDLLTGKVRVSVN